MMTDFQTMYREKIIPALKQKFCFKSVMEVPRLQKITLNMGVGEAVSDKKILDRALDDLTKIAGQKPVTTYARKSEAGFKIRAGWPIGCKVTLRGNQMYDFLQRLIMISIPRITDFRGFPLKSFDGRGNFSFGIREQIVFPEIDYDTIDAVRGLDVIMTTSASNNEQGMALLRAFGFPLKEDRG